MRRPVAHVLASLACLGACGLLAVRAAPAADDRKSFRDMKLFRFEFDNDSFIGSDDAFTAGWSFQLHSRPMDTWNPAFAGWIGKLPGLGDDGQGGRIARWATALSQIIVTPSDISNPAPQPDDAPWAGILGVTLTWSAYDNKRLAGLQVYLGCMGPCSQGDTVQEFIHDDLGLGEPPAGWDNQLSNEVLANLNYQYRHKLYVAKAEAHAYGRFAHDLTLGGEAGAGNLVTFARADLEFRFGWGLPMGFTKIPDPPGIGTVLDPVYFDPVATLPQLNRWSYSFNVVARYAWIGRLAPAEGGPTESGGYHPPVGSFPGTVQGIFGAHFVRVPFGVHVTYYRYFDDPNPALKGTLDWINLSLEYRF